MRHLQRNGEHSHPDVNGAQDADDADVTARYVPAKGSHGKKHGWFHGPETDRAREGALKQNERHLGKSK
jgi:hypothetical protein